MVSTTKLRVNLFFSSNNNAESDAENKTITMHNFQLRIPRTPLPIPDGTNSVILSMLKTNGKNRPAHPSTVGLFDGGSKSFNSKCDRSFSPIKNTSRRAYIDSYMDKKPTHFGTHINNQVPMNSSRKEWRKISVKNKFFAEDSEIASQYLNILFESTNDGTLVDGLVCSSDYIERDPPTYHHQLLEPFADPQLSPFTSITFESSEQSPKMMSSTQVTLPFTIYLQSSSTCIVCAPGCRFKLNATVIFKQPH
jgi:hypothetical protein